MKSKATFWIVHHKLQCIVIRSHKSVSSIRKSGDFGKLRGPFKTEDNAVRAYYDR
jgi:hypothetical protein